MKKKTKVDGNGWYFEKRWRWVSDWIMAYFYFMPIISLLLKKVNFEFTLQFLDEETAFTGITFNESNNSPDGYLIEGKIDGPNITFKKIYAVHSDNPNHIIYKLKRCGNGDVYKGEWKFYVFDYADLDYCIGGRGRAKIKLNPVKKVERRWI